MPTQTQDSDSDVEFEDVLPQLHQNNTSPHITWTPTLILPNQQPAPFPLGSEAETQLRGRLTTGIERITYRQMKADMGMDTDVPGIPLAQRRYPSFNELANDVEGVVDMLWASATPSIQVEGLITLAGIIELSLKSYPFDPESTLGILHKFDSVFTALCTGVHPLTNAPLPGSQGPPLVTQTQKVRIRSLAEMTRNKIFSILPDPDPEDEFDVEQPWVLEATRVYDGVLMLLADLGDVGELRWR